MGYIKVPVKMKAKKEAHKRRKKVAEDALSELNAPRWSVVTFETCAASGLTYDEAAEELKNLHAKKISGLCIITDEAARRISQGK